RDAPWAHRQLGELGVTGAVHRLHVAQPWCVEDGVPGDEPRQPCRRGRTERIVERRRPFPHPTLTVALHRVRTARQLSGGTHVYIGWLHPQPRCGSKTSSPTRQFCVAPTRSGAKSVRTSSLTSP